MATINPDMSGIVDGAVGDAADWKTPMNTIINAINGTLDSSNLSATSGVLPTQLASNAALIPKTGSIITAGAITLQVAQVSIAPGANSSSASSTSWGTPFSTLLGTWASITANNTNNQTFINGTDSSSTTLARAIAYNTSGSSNTVTVLIFGIGII